MDENENDGFDGYVENETELHDLIAMDRAETLAQERAEVGAK